MRALVLILVLSLSSLVRAEGVDVVVTGEAAFNGAIDASTTVWLTKHNFHIKPSSLPSDGILTLSNCLSLTDMKCARSVVEARGKANIVAILTQASGSGAKRTIQLSAYWIGKGSDVVSVQRTCDACTDQQLPQTIDALMTDLARLAPLMRGKVKVTSTPPGVIVNIDDNVVGVTPVEHELTAGAHKIVLTRGSTELAKRRVEITPEETAELEIKVAAPDAPVPTMVEHRRSRTVPVTLVAVGGVGIITGLVMYKVGGPSGDNFMYRDLHPPGIGIAVGGGLVAILGAILLARGPTITTTTSTPTVAIAPGGVVAGWSRSF